MESYTLIAGILIGFVVFLVLREFWCWFWKINEIRNLLRQILKKLDSSTPETAKTTDGAIREDDTIAEGDIVICRRCGSFKEAEGFCPNCRSGWAGKKVSFDTWNELSSMSKSESKSLTELLKESAICKKCGSLMKKDDPCPNCGEVFKKRRSR